MTIANLMYHDVVSVKRDTSIQEAAELMWKSCVSSLPVMDESGSIVGLLTENDLIGRLKVRRRSWWQAFTDDAADLAREYRKRHGVTVAEVMRPAPAVVTPDLSIEAAADLLSQDGMREVPVVSDGRLVGSVSRTDLLAVLAELPRRTEAAHTDDELVAEMKTRLSQEPWVSNRTIWISAKNGVLTLFGLIDTEEEKTALGLMAQTIPGCKGAENNLFPKSLLPRRGHWL